MRKRGWARIHSPWRRAVKPPRAAFLHVSRRNCVLCTLPRGRCSVPATRGPFCFAIGFAVKEPTSVLRWSKFGVRRNQKPTETPCNASIVLMSDTSGARLLLFAFRLFFVPRHSDVACTVRAVPLNAPHDTCDVYTGSHGLAARRIASLWCRLKQARTGPRTGAQLITHPHRCERTCCVTPSEFHA